MIYKKTKHMPLFGQLERQQARQLFRFYLQDLQLFPRLANKK